MATRDPISEHSKRADDARRRHRPRARALAVVALLLLHTAGVLYVYPLSGLLGEDPLGPPGSLDIYAAYGRVSALVEASADPARAWWSTWIYDPRLLAGYSTGLAFDMDVKGHVFGVLFLRRLGLATAAAYNLVGALAGLLGPPLIWLAARALRTGPRPQLITLGLAVLVWHLDSSARLFGLLGLTPLFATAAALSVLTLALWHRGLASPGAEGRGPRLLALALTPLCALLHASALWVLVAPLLALALRHRGRGRIALLPIAGLALTLLVLLPWLLPALTHRDWAPRPLDIVRSASGHATPLSFFTDLLELTLDTAQTGAVAQRTFYRFAALLAALAGVAALRRRGDERWFLGAIAMTWLFGLAYTGALLPIAGAPYRMIVPASLLACVFAGPELARVCTRAWLSRRPAGTRALLVIGGLLLVPRAVDPLLYHAPELERALGLKTRALAPDVAELTWPRSGRRFPVDGLTRALGRYVDEQLPAGGRVLVLESPALAEYLAASTSRAIVGPLPGRRLAGAAGQLPPLAREDALAEYLERHAVRFVIDPVPAERPLARARALLQPHRLVEKAFFIHEVRHPSELVAEGAAQVDASRPGRVSLTKVRPAAGTQRITLRLRPAPGLRCEPDCEVMSGESGSTLMTIEGRPTLPAALTIRGP